MQTENDYPISSSWVDINALSGIAIGQQMALHNAGRAGDIIEVAVSELEPISTFRGIAIKALSPMFLVSPQDLPLWVRYIRYDLTGTITPLPVRTCLINVQSIADIQEIGGIPSSLLTTNDESMRLKTSSASIQEQQITEGRFFVGSTERTGVTLATPIYDSVITAGGKGFVIDDLIITLDFANTADGSLSYSLSVYVDSSNGNSWSYVPIASTPVGRSLNTDFINNFPLSTIQSGVSATVSGAADYNIYFADYYVDTSGNRDDSSVTEIKFFDSGRQIILTEGTEILVRATIAGDATGSVDIRTIFFSSESE